MRSTALQACRHLRPASVGIATTTTTTRILRPLTITLTTTSTSPSSSRSASTTAPRPISSSYARNTGRKTTTTTTTDTASKASEGNPAETLLDPQAAIPPSFSIADVDPALAASIPTPAAAAAAATAPANAFNAAISNSTGAGAPNDAPNNPGQNGNGTIDWSSSFHGLSTVPFSPETAQILMKPLDPGDVEIKPDGIIYLPEIKYRRILNLAFGPGGWGLAPRGELVVGEKVVTREYALVVHGRFVAQARGECQYFAEETIPTAGEGCKSNALMRCCKDLGIASELWDPRFIREFKKKHCKEIWVEHVVNKKRRQVWVLKDGEPTYPYKAVTSSSSSSSSGYSRP